MIYTHDEAYLIVEMFENILDRYGVSLPSPEDDERDPDNDAALYGSTYSALFDDVEAHVISLLERCKSGEKISEGVFSGTI